MTARQQIDLLQDENAASLQRSIQAATQANDVGNETLVTLGQQREQLQRMNNNLHEINQHMDQSDTTIRSMRSWFGSLFGRKIQTAMPKTSPKGGSSSAAATTPSASGPAGSTTFSTAAGADVTDRTPSPSARTPSSKKKGAGTEEVNPTARRVVELPPDIAQRQVQEDAALDTLSELVGQLHQKGMAMNSELDHHAELIDEVGHGIDHNIGRLQKSNAELKKLLS